MIGTTRRLGRLFHAKSDRSVILPLDHGASEGMIPGLSEVPQLLAGMRELSVQGAVLHKGLARALGQEVDQEKQLVIQLTAGTKHGVPTYNQSVVCSMAEALSLGADAVSLHINIGNDLEYKMLQDFGMVTDEAHRLGLPVLAVLYARGGQIVNELDPSLIGHCIRLGGELGADLVCVPYSGEQTKFRQAVANCPVPVLVTGGPSQPDWASFLNMIGEALQGGAAGVMAGRNIFQHENPMQALSELCSLVHEGACAKQAGNGKKKATKNAKTPKNGKVR